MTEAPIPTAVPAASAIRKLFRWLRAPVLIAAIGAICLALFGTWRYGSPSAAILVIRGYALAVSPAHQSLAEATAMENVRVPFAVRNLKSVPVTIVGCKTSCRCTGLPDLPVTISAGETIDLFVALAPVMADVGKPLSGHARLYLDIPSPPIFVSVSMAEVVLPKAAANTLVNP